MQTCFDRDLFLSVWQCAKHDWDICSYQCDSPIHWAECIKCSICSYQWIMFVRVAFWYQVASPTCFVFPPNRGTLFPPSWGCLTQPSLWRDLEAVFPTEKKGDPGQFSDWQHFSRDFVATVSCVWFWLSMFMFDMYIYIYIYVYTYRCGIGEGLDMHFVLSAYPFESLPLL